MILNFHFDYLNPSLMEPVKNVLTDFVRSGGTPPPTPLTENYFAKKPLAERGVHPPLENRRKFSLKNG